MGGLHRSQSGGSRSSITGDSATTFAPTGGTRDVDGPPVHGRVHTGNRDHRWTGVSHNGAGSTSSKEAGGGKHVRRTRRRLLRRGNRQSLDAAVGDSTNPGVAARQRTPDPNNHLLSSSRHHGQPNNKPSNKLTSLKADRCGGGTQRQNSNSPSSTSTKSQETPETSGHSKARKTEQSSGNDRGAPRAPPAAPPPPHQPDCARQWNQKTTPSWMAQPQRRKMQGSHAEDAAVLCGTDAASTGSAAATTTTNRRGTTQHEQAAAQT